MIEKEINYGKQDANFWHNVWGEIRILWMVLKTAGKLEDACDLIISILLKEALRNPLLFSSHSSSKDSATSRTESSSGPSKVTTLYDPEKKNAWIIMDCSGTRIVDGAVESWCHVHLCSKPPMISPITNNFNVLLR